MLAALLAVALLLVLGACGGDDGADGADGADGTDGTDDTSASASPSTALPTGDVEVPDDVELTPAGADLDFGDTATVAYQVGDAGSVVELTVVAAQTARIRDLAAYQLDRATRRSTPYYVRVRVANVGTGQLGRRAVPLFAVDGRDTLVQPSTFTTPFERCPSRPLPRRFGPGAETTTCLVYLLPDRGSLEALSYRPLQSFEPITWSGEVRPPR